MKTFEYDLHYLQAGVEVLDKYLLSDEVFWPVSAKPPKGEPDYPQLTLGGMLLSKQRLAAYPMSREEEMQLQQLSGELERMRARWRVAWEKKAGHSFSVRLRMWAGFLDDYRTSPPENADRYPYEVRLRAMLQLLQAEAGGQLQAEIDLLSGLDKYLRSVLKPGSFLWEQELQHGFPKGVYWYLYGYLP